MKGSDFRGDRAKDRAEYDARFFLNPNRTNRAQAPYPKTRRNGLKY